MLPRPDRPHDQLLMQMRWRVFTAAVMAASLVLVGCQPQAPDLATPRHLRQAPTLARLAPPPPAPNLGRYAAVSADDYLVTEQYTEYVSFQTPDGLTCRIGSVAGCDGAMHGTPAPANEVVLYGHPPVAGEVEPDAFRHTAKPQFTGATGPGGDPPARSSAGHRRARWPR